ncbi:MAG: hypothetical protein IKQ72_12465 [Bacteroidaceae bacterium]|nr:hypothetical protein [Bacteroidaceae bacterium]
MSHLYIYADGDKSMTITSTNHTDAEYSVTSISSVKYENGKMIIALKNGSVQSFNVADIKSMIFGSITSAIESMTSNDSSVPYTIFDDSGKVVASGMTNENGKVDTPANMKGVFVIKVGDKCKKVIIK